MSTHLVIDELTREFQVKTRAKLRGRTAVSEWATWFLIPVKDYVEASTYGPYSITEVEWIEIDPVVETQIGRLVKSSIRNYTKEIREQLDAEKIRFETHEQMVRVWLG